MADVGMDDRLTAIFDAHVEGKPSAIMADVNAILRLARMDELEYARTRKDEAKLLGISVAALDKEVNSQRRSIRVRTVAAGRPWLEKCQISQQGEVRSNLLNTFLPMRDDPRVSSIVRYDEMLGLVMLMQPIPGTQLNGQIPFEPRPIRDADYSLIQEWLQREGLETVAATTTRQVVDARARELSFHPVVQWLDAIEWDGKQRLGNWLSKYLGAPETPYTTAVGAFLLTSMVARVRKPGCKCDYMVILEGDQGTSKSTACSIIGGDYYSDNLPDIRTGKDVSAHLTGKWLLEIGEMSSMEKAEVNACKTFITRPIERFRPSYGHAETIVPRQCIFVGTTNKKAYLRDETGGRRFWPVVTTVIDTDALARDREQLFAEADEWFQAGNPWWPDREFEAKYIAPEQSARYESDAWEDQILPWLDTLHDSPKTIVWNDKPLQDSRCTVLMVARLAMHLDAQKIGTLEQRRITNALLRLGWIRGTRSNAGQPFEPGPEAVARQNDRKASRSRAV